jgi:co-chaperonin GroES (HSP10)
METRQMDNTSGYHPVEYKCVFKPDVIEEVSKGGIALPPDVVNKEQGMQCDGTLVAAGATAFQDWPRDGKPQVGARVMIAKYAGIQIKGKDEKVYRLVNDKDILAVELP